MAFSRVIRRVGDQMVGVMSFGVPILGFFASLAIADDGPTFHKDVEPILQRRCQDCHRPGQVAPFSLLTYEHARKRAADLAAVTTDRRMPPWHASTEIGGPFQDARVLTEAELRTIRDWADAGAPEGKTSDAPAPMVFTSEWALGPPDLVLKPSEAYMLGAEGKDEFRVFVVPTGLREGRWLSAVDFKPGNPRVVHHILAAFDATGAARKLDDADPRSGYAVEFGFGRQANGMPMFPSGGLGGWAPGKAPRRLPDGVGRYIPANADILIQIHYHKDGKEESDTTAIGLYFAKSQVQKQIVGGAVLPPRKQLGIRPDMRIPAGDGRYEVTGSLTLHDDFHAVAVVPHMHLIGKDFRLTAGLPDGTNRDLILVDRWDFNWQETYEFQEPVPLPNGTVIHMIAHFDNSAANPANPFSPPRDITWGEQTTNEMCIGFLQMTRDSERLEGRPPGRGGRLVNFDDPSEIRAILRARALRGNAETPRPW